MLSYWVGTKYSSGVAQYLMSSEHIPEMRMEGILGSELSMTHVPLIVAKKLGIDITSELNIEQFSNLLKGRRVDGSEIQGKRVTKASKNTYIDFTFTAPKSFSVVLAFAEPEEKVKLEIAYRNAVDALAKHLESQVATASIGNTKDGRNHKREEAQACIIKIEHDCARPTLAIPNGQDTDFIQLAVSGDPNRHTHIIMLNHAITKDGRITSINQDALGQHIYEWGTIGEAFLATELRKLGVDVELDSTPGLKFNQRGMRLTAIPRWVSDEFSKRSKNAEIAARELCREKGWDFDSMSIEGKASLRRYGAHTTRLKGKASRSTGSEYASWIKQAAAIGYRHRAVVRPGYEQELRAPEVRHREAYNISLPLIEERLDKKHVISGSVARIAAAKGLIQTGIASASEVNIITAAHRSEGIVQDGEKTRIHYAMDPEKRFARLTTQISIDQEEEIIRHFKSIVTNKTTAIPKNILEAAIKKVESEGFDFSEKHGLLQRDIIYRVADSGQAFAFVGIAGSGKSTLLRPLIQAWSDMGMDVYGATLAWRQTHGLKEAGIGRLRPEANTDTLVNSGVPQERAFAMAQLLRRLDSGQIKLNNKSVLVIDEAALIGTKQLLQIKQHQAKQGFKLVAVGDDMQNKPVEAGATLDIFRRSFGVENVPELVSTVRQFRDIDKETTLLFRKGKADEAIARKDADNTLRVVPGGYSDAIKAAVDLYQDRIMATKNEKNYTIGISVPTNADGRAIGEEIHKRRLEAGDIKRAICIVDATDQLGDKYKLEISAGDKVRLFDRVYGTDGSNRRGSRAVVGNNGSVVEVVSATDIHLTVKKASGGIASIEWSDLRGPNKDGNIRLTRGDAITIDTRQSETLSENITVFPAGSGAVDAFRAYVSESRHRYVSWMVTSHGAEKKELESRRPIGDRDNYEKDASVIHKAVLANIARNLSRQQKDTLATDFRDRAVGLKVGTVNAGHAFVKRRVSPTVYAPKPSAPTQAQVPSQPAQPPAIQTVAQPAKVTQRPAPKIRRTRVDLDQARDDFATTLSNLGLRLPGLPIMDGQKHPVPVEGNTGSRKSGFYRSYAGGTRGYGHNSLIGSGQSWNAFESKEFKFTNEEKKKFEEVARAERIAKAHARQALEIKASKQAAEIWNAAESVNPQHPYLTKKGIQGIGIRQATMGQTAEMTDGKIINISNRLVVPIVDAAGKIKNVQLISENYKTFLPGTKKGYFAIIRGSEGPLMFAEGYATASTVHRLTGLSVVVTLDAGNVLPVAEEMRRKFPERAFIFASDNDHEAHTKGPNRTNVGLIKFTEAANVVGGVVVEPKFTKIDKGMSDWNDFESKYGTEKATEAMKSSFHAKGFDTPPAARTWEEIQTSRNDERSWHIQKHQPSPIPVPTKPQVNQSRMAQ